MANQVTVCGCRGVNDELQLRSTASDKLTRGFYDRVFSKKKKMSVQLLKGDRFLTKQNIEVRPAGSF